MRVDGESGWGLRADTELGVLRISVTVIVLFAGLGITMGLLSGSFAIVFDGVYSLIDACMTTVGCWWHG